MNDRLALGSAQFGLDYGIANKTGQVQQAIVSNILDVCRVSGIDTIDTAIAYGNSEAQLGTANIADMKIVTKLPSLPSDVRDVHSWVLDNVKGSLSRLGVSKLHGILLHRSLDVIGPSGTEIIAALNALKTDGLVAKIGTSIYAPDELDRIYPHFKVDLVQAPFNVVDQRLITSGWLHRLKENDVEVHTRSAFLQGLLLMPEGKRPEKFNRWSNIWKAWHSWLDDNKLSALEGALGFVLSHADLDRIVVGVDSVQQLQEILASSGVNIPPAPQECVSTDVELIDPSHWS